MDAFEKLEVWQRSARLSVTIYQSLKTCASAGFRDQLFRAGLSIPSNIAEGYERGSRKEFIRFLNLAKGSCAEVRTQLYIGMETGILDKATSVSCGILSVDGHYFPLCSDLFYLFFMGNRPTAGLRTLTPSIQVRILVPQPSITPQRERLLDR